MNLSMDGRQEAAWQQAWEPDYALAENPIQSPPVSTLIDGAFDFLGIVIGFAGKPCGSSKVQQRAALYERGCRLKSDPHGRFDRRQGRMPRDWRMR